MATTFDIIVLSNEDVAVVSNINKTHPRGPQMIPCCYYLDSAQNKCSKSSLLAEDLLNNPVYTEWKNALELLAPMESRPRHTIQQSLEDQ